jgi:hypothetical protein
MSGKSVILLLVLGLATMLLNLAILVGQISSPATARRNQRQQIAGRRRFHRWPYQDHQENCSRLLYGRQEKRHRLPDAVREVRQTIAESRRSYMVGNTENRSPARRTFSASELAGSSWTASTRADGGPRRHNATISATTAAGPANSASTRPSLRLRTQPSSLRANAWCSTQAR